MPGSPLRASEPAATPAGAPSGWRASHVEVTVRVDRPRDRVWRWLVDPATFVDAVRLQFWLVEEGAGTGVRIATDALVRPVLRPAWEAANRVFWQRFGTWAERAC